MESTLDHLFKDETTDANKILSELLSDKNLDMKTHIQDPITFAILEGVINNLEELLVIVKMKKKQFPITTKLLKDIIKLLKKFLVSWKRLSRIEVTDTLKATKEQEQSDRSLFSRLSGLRK